MSYDTEITLRDLALAYPAVLGVLESHHLDYCCGGGQSLADACKEVGIDPEWVLREVQGAELPAPTHFSCDTLTALVAHIVESHHAFARRSLVRIGELTERVVRRHGDAHPELGELRSCFRSLASDLLPHLGKEEEILFPYIKALEAHATAGAPLPEASFGSVSSPVAMMTHEHEAVGSLLKQARKITRDYALPGDACTSFERLYREFEALESDLMRHIHLENNLLFPRAVALEQGI